MSQRIPDRIRAVLSDISSDAQMNDGVLAVMERSSDFESTLAAKLAGIYMNPQARHHFDDELDRWWAKGKSNLPESTPEVVVGAGLHAAIYCAMRVQAGHPKPLVLEASDRAGGAFAISKDPTFYLNSRNRPGELGIPGRDEALNIIPGAVIQPAFLSSEEYQPNTSLAFAIRSTLAMCAKVITGVKVREPYEINSTLSVVLGDDRDILTDRIIWATGLGSPKNAIASLDVLNDDRVMTYFEFLKRMDNPFPFREMKRVAVIGSGDSGRTVVEALIGQGPTHRMSSASIDWIEQIDWYGLNPEEQTREGWQDCNRSRYRGIGRALPSRYNMRIGRVCPVRPGNRVQRVTLGMQCAYVDGIPYDAIIIATGFDRDRRFGLQDCSLLRYGDRAIGRLTQIRDCYGIGPVVQIEETEPFVDTEKVPENSVAIFRYADRTAALAHMFD